MPKRCRRTGKLSWRSEGEAAAMLRIMHRSHGYRKENGYYKCTKCPYWHVTSHGSERRKKDG